LTAPAREQDIDRPAPRPRRITRVTRKVFPPPRPDNGPGATPRGFKLEVSQLDNARQIETDRLLVVGAVVNLLRNAFKFSPPGGTIGLRVSEIAGERVCIEVEDECGGLPPGDEEGLFQSFEQRNTDRSGLGLGLAVSRQNIRAIGGELRVRNLPERGCIFSLELPL
jgi:signal transduction histidine kinase